MILLRGDGYPCVFWGDLYGCEGKSQQPPINSLPTIIKARNLFSYGDTIDYWGHHNCMGWVRVGDSTHDGCAVVLSNGDEGCVLTPSHPNPYPLASLRWKHMEVGTEHAGEEWTDILGWHQGVVKIAENGWGDFRCSGESVSIWVKVGARGRDGF